MYQVVIILLLVLAGCATTATSVNANNAFTPYQDEFISEAKQRGIRIEPVRIEVGTVGSTDYSVAANTINLGMCYPSSSFYAAHIVINSKAWAKLSNVQREILIYHELFHCTLNRPHGNGIMEPALIDENLYLSAKRQLLDGAFRATQKSSRTFEELSHFNEGKKR